LRGRVRGQAQGKDCGAQMMDGGVNSDKAGAIEGCVPLLVPDVVRAGVRWCDEVSIQLSRSGCVFVSEGGRCGRVVACAGSSGSPAKRG
jgi:hypothetical protein